jgi:hypothetical protein
MGHTTPGLALSIYAQVMRHGEDDRAALAALVDGSNAAGFTPIDADEPSAHTVE